MEERGLTVVPERLSEMHGKTVTGVIATDNNGRRFRVLETAGTLTLEIDASPREAAPTWIVVEGAQETLRSTLAAMLDVMKR
jgi:hypothetical protein